MVTRTQRLIANIRRSPMRVRWCTAVRVLQAVGMNSIQILVVQRRSRTLVRRAGLVFDRAQPSGWWISQAVEGAPW